MKLVAVVGDQETQECAFHGTPVCTGEGTYSIEPDQPQNQFVYINNKLVLLNGDQFEAHGTATLEASSTVLFINGVAVVRDGDTIDHHHDNDGVCSIQQNFVRSD